MANVTPTALLLCREWVEGDGAREGEAKTTAGDFPSSLYFQCRKSRLWSLAWELRSHVLCGTAEKKDDTGKWVAVMVRGGGCGPEDWTPQLPGQPTQVTAAGSLGLWVQSRK